MEERGHIFEFQIFNVNVQIFFATNCVGLLLSLSEI